MSDLDKSISHCESEALHLIGGVQSWGCLLGGSSSGTTIRFASTNCESYLGQTIERLLDRPLADIVPAVDFPDQPMQGKRYYFPSIPVSGGAELDAVLSFSGDNWLLELEPVSQDPGFNQMATQPIHSLMVSPGNATQWQGYLLQTAEAIRHASGFDRVMMYQFLDDGSGEVVAETGSGALGSYLGLRFPASDVPQIARDLYMVNYCRVISDVAAPPVDIRAQKHGDTPDLTYSDLRAVSPAHIEYLHNMRVGASASFSIIYAGKLWGLVACHHETSRHLDYPTRVRCAELAHAFSLGLSAYESNRRLIHLNKIDEYIQSAVDLLEASVGDSQPSRELSKALVGIVSAHGAAMVDGGAIYVMGQCPSRTFIEDLDKWFLSTLDSPVFSTDCISEHLAGAETHAAMASGVVGVSLMVRTDRARGGRRFYWFRPEIRRVIEWAGDPEKPVELINGETRLSPRNSFEVYREQTRYRSQPWTAMDDMAAKKFRGLVLRRLAASQLIRL